MEAGGGALWHAAARARCTPFPAAPDHKLSGYDLALGPRIGDAGGHVPSGTAAPKAKWTAGSSNDTFVASGVSDVRGCAEHDATLRKYSTDLDLDALDTNT